MSKEKKLPLVRHATKAERDKWDTLIANNPGGGDTYQSSAMADVKSHYGWTPEYWVYETSLGTIYATVLTRKFFAVGKLAYIMRGPNIKSPEQLREIMSANAKKDDYFLIKMDPIITELPGDLVAKNAHVATPEKLLKARNIQPHSQQVVIDLTRSEDDILASFSQTARREIRAAKKDRITVKKVPLTEENMQTMYHLYEAMGQRAKLFIRPYHYYKQFWMAYTDRKQGELYFAQSKSSETIAGAYIIQLGKKSIYKDGGSIRTAHRHFAHFLQWQVMLDLKKAGATEYNLMSTQASGLAIFKRSFSPLDITHVGTYDQILHKKAYKRWTTWAEKLNQTIASKLRHTTLY
jgi:lipid II:glycine glycyltransferase (peptidoglycan interpeptide bridge formation enzyme)